MKRALDIIGFGVIALVAVVLLGALFNSDDSEPASEADAFYYSQKAVEGILKAPSTAEFAKFHTSTVTSKGEDVFEVVSYVDSQNGFGAMIRSHYKVRVTFVNGRVKTSVIEFD